MSRAVDPSTSTIVAPATAPGRGEVALVRLSGPEAAAIADRLFLPETNPPGGGAAVSSVRRGHFRLALDDSATPAELPALRIDYPEGRSYTGEESVEWLLPGVPMLMRAVLRAIERAGAVPAGPGEFTRRAFERGRIDLTQAESVAALIAAEDITSLRAARQTLDGSLASAIAAIGDRLHDQIALLEAGLDFGDQDVESPSFDALVAELQAIESELAAASARPDPGSAVGEVRRVLIWGRANAGKSTLLNALLGRDAALVSDREGTTTDAVSARLSLPGGAVELLDLPGRKEERTPLEEAAEELARAELDSGDPILYLLAATESQERRDAEWESLPSEIRERATPVLCQVDRMGDREPAATPERGLRCSAVTPSGLDEVRAWLREQGTPRAHRAEGAEVRALGAAFNDRQRAGMDACRETLHAVREAIASGVLLEPELVVIDLRRSHESLQEVTGELATEETLTRIFSRFCVGK